METRYAVPWTAIQYFHGHISWTLWTNFIVLLWSSIFNLRLSNSVVGNEIFNCDPTTRIYRPILPSLILPILVWGSLRILIGLDEFCLRIWTNICPRDISLSDSYTSDHWFFIQSGIEYQYLARWLNKSKSYSFVKSPHVSQNILRMPCNLTENLG